MRRSVLQEDRARNDKFRALLHVNDALALFAILLILSGCLSGSDNDPTGRTSRSNNHPPVVKFVLSYRAH